VQFEAATVYHEPLAPRLVMQSRWVSHLWVLVALADGAKFLSSEQAIDATA